MPTTFLTSVLITGARVVLYPGTGGQKQARLWGVKRGEAGTTCRVWSLDLEKWLLLEGEI